MEDAVQSLVTHLLSSSSTLPLKRLTSTSVSASPSAVTAGTNVLGPSKSGVTTRPQGSAAGLPTTSNAHDNLIHVIRRPPNAEPISCPTVSSSANQIHAPVIFNLPLGNPGGLLIVRNSQPPEPTVVTVSQPVVAHGWSQFMPRTNVAQSSSETVGNSRQIAVSQAPPEKSGGNFLLESPQVSAGKLPAAAVPVNIFHHSSDDSGSCVKNEFNISKTVPSLDASAFDIEGFPVPIETGNFDSGGPQILAGQETELPIGGVCELGDSKSSLTSDVLDDLLHIVNESLGPHADTVDYDLALDDETSLISMVVSPNSGVPESTTVGCNTELAKITDYCPEWSYVEVCYSYFVHALMAYFLQATAECFAHLSHCLGVHLFVCLSVCLSVRLSHLWSVSKRCTSSLWASPRTLVYHDKISCPWMRGFPPNKGIKEWYSLKRCYFAIIGSYSVKTVSDTYRHATYHNKHW